MARAGETIRNPLTGERITFRRTMRDTGGQALELEFWLEPGGAVPVAHIHPRQEERFRVLSGRVRLLQGSAERELAPGDEAAIAPGVAHRLANAGADEAHLLVEFRPAGAAERFFEIFFGLCRDGHVRPSGQLSPYQAAVLMGETHFGYLASPPVPLQRLVFALLRPIGRLRGEPARYRRYAAEAGRSDPRP